MALGSIQPPIEINTRNLPGGKQRPVRKADNLTTICEPILQKMWQPRSLTTLWAFTACYRDNFTFCSASHTNGSVSQPYEPPRTVTWIR
jgi:hypothetical protein